MCVLGLGLNRGKCGHAEAVPLQRSRLAAASGLARSPQHPPTDHHHRQASRQKVMQQPIWWFAGAGNPVAAPVVCVLGLGLNRGECGHAERDHHVDLMRLFFLGDAPAARTLDRDGATDGELRPSNSIRAFVMFGGLVGRERSGLGFHDQAARARPRGREPPCGAACPARRNRNPSRRGQWGELADPRTFSNHVLARSVGAIGITSLLRSRPERRKRGPSDHHGTAMRVVVGHCPRDRVPDATCNRLHVIALQLARARLRRCGRR